MSPGANELLLASGVAPACTPPVCWCFRPGVVAVVLVLLSSSSSSSVPEPSSDSASTTVTFSWMEVLMVAALWDMTPSGLAVSIIRTDDGGSKLFPKRRCTCVRLYGVIFRKAAICNDDCGDKVDDGGGDCAVIMYRNTIQLHVMDI